MAVRPANVENLKGLADTIVWAAGAYGSRIDLEVQTGEILVPTTTVKGDGHIVKVLYTGFTPDRVVSWTYDLVNTKWFGVELL